MINVNTLKSTYIVFTSAGEFAAIMIEFDRLGFGYKNGSIGDAVEKVATSTVDKVICHDGFILTSKEKVTTMSCKSFLRIASSITSNSALVSNNTNPTNNMSTSNTAGIKAVANRLKAKKLFGDEKAVDAVLARAESIGDLTSNFIATLDKAQDKANRLAELGSAYADAIDSQDVIEMERLENLMVSVEEYVTKGNTLLASINTVGAKIIKSESKVNKAAGKTFIWE